MRKTNQKLCRTHSLIAALTVLWVLLICLTGCGTAKKNITSQEIDEKPRLENWTHEFVSLSENLLGEDPAKNVRVYLPPSYYESEKRYPVVYFLHGYQGSPGQLIITQSSGDNAFTAKGAKEMIIVEPSGRNLYQGAFWVNSPATGKYEDYITQELVTLIDSRYRTLAQAKSRGIAGFSMGGFGALYLGMRHPDIFSAVLALSPGVFPEEEVASAMPTWNNMFLNAYGLAFAPDLSGEKPKPRIPVLDNTPEDKTIVEFWNRGYGDWRNKIEAYQSLDSSLKGLKIVYGTRDSYPWIPQGCQYLDTLLDEYGIRHETETFDGGHMIETSFLSKILVPFFNRNLGFK